MSLPFRFQARYLIVIGALTTLGIPLYLGVLLQRDSDHADKAYGWVEHTHAILNVLESLQSTVRQGESEQRAYLLTRHVRFAERFRKAAQRAPELVKEVQALVTDNPGQAALGASLDQTVTKRLAMLEANSNLALSDVPALSQRLEVSAEASTELEAIIDKMRTEENRLLGLRRITFNTLRGSLRFEAATAICMGAVVLLGIGYLLFRENRSRLRHEARIAEARDAALDAVSATAAFVASISHEIRTPMNGILGSADLLLRSAELSQKQRRGMEVIVSSARSLLVLMNDLLDLSKVQAGQMMFVVEDFSLLEVVEEVVALFASTAAKKELEVTNHIAPNIPEQMKGDRLRLRQVLINLVSNAVKFTEQGGIQIGVVRRSELEQEGKVYLRFEVRDTGPGITEEAQGQLFKAFSQVDAKLARRHGGTGLGLAISLELVRRMSGSMGVDSEVGAGSTFWFVATFGTADMHQYGQGSDLRQHRIVIVENRPLTAESISAHVDGWGMSALSFSRAEEVHGELPASWAGAGRIAIVLGAPSQEECQRGIKVLGSRSWLKNAEIFLLPGDEALCVEKLSAPITACLQYPFRPSQLYNLLSGKESGVQNFEFSAFERLPEATIIVADDNPINRQVISNQLEYLGLPSVLCSGGMEALAKVCDGAGQLVLMDCQMPDVDGFEATRLIRAWEMEQGRERIPIIAVTANVMAGDAEHCLLAGMDGYLAKPLVIEELQKCLRRWLVGGGGEPAPAEAIAQAAIQPAPAASVLDQEQLHSCLTGDRRIDAVLISDALKQATEQLELMRGAISQNELWEQSAHCGRGSSAVLGFVEVAKKFEGAEYEATSVEARVQILGEIAVAVKKVQIQLAALGWD